MAQKSSTFSIVIPAYNEEKRLPACLDAVIEYVNKSNQTIELVVAEDGSKDKTYEIAKEYSRKHPWIKVVHSPDRLGKGGGLLNGLNAASNEIVLLMDADLAVPLSEISKLVEKIKEGADIAIGSRGLPDSVILKRQPWFREFAGRCYNKLFRILFKIKISDTQCGFKAFKRDVLKFLLSRVSTDGYAFDTDLIVRAFHQGYKIAEVPVTWSHMEGSKVNVRNQSIEMASALLRVWLQMLNEKKKNLKKEETRKKESLRAFYDKVPGDSYYKASKSAFLPRKIWHKRKNSRILSSLPRSSRPMLVLDAGTGSGTVAEKIASMGYRVVGIDIGKGFIKFASNRARKEGKERLNYIRSDVANAPLKSDVCDVVVCSEVIEHLPNPEIAIKEFARVLKPSGLLIVTTPATSLLWTIIETVWTKVRKENLETEHTSFTTSQLKRFMSQAGLEIRTLKPFMMRCLIFAVAQKV